LIDRSLSLSYLTTKQANFPVPQKSFDTQLIKDSSTDVSITLLLTLPQFRVMHQSFSFMILARFSASDCDNWLKSIKEG